MEVVDLLIGTVVGGIGGFLLRDYPLHLVQRSAKNAEKLEQWHTKTRNNLTDALSLGREVMIEQGPTDDFQEKLLIVTRSLQKNIQNAPEAVDEDLKELLQGTNNELLSLTQVSKMDSSTSIGEVIQETLTLAHEIPVQTETNIEDSVERVGGMITSDGRTLGPSEIMGFIHLFVDLTQPGLEPEDINSFEDLGKLEWGLIEEEISEEQKQHIIDDAFNMAYRTALIQFPTLAMTKVNQSEDDLL